MKKMFIKIFYLSILLSSFSYSFMVTAVELLEKVYLQSRCVSSMSKVRFSEYLLTNPYRVEAFNALSKNERIKLYLEISKVSPSKQGSYLRKFNEVEDGDKILINAVKNNKNLDDVLKNTVKTTNSRRRITSLEKELMTSHNARKEYLFGRSVVKRDIFDCSRNNINLMKKGLAPYARDGKKVNLHHLKQQRHGALIELTQTEHNKHSSVLHRYVKNGSEIIDRNGDFQIFKKQYWKNRAIGCVVRGK